MNYYLHIIILIEIYIILALSLNLQLGFTGLMNLGMGIFYGFGAYTYAIVSMKFGIGFSTALILSILVNMILSLFISFASFRFKDDVFILVSLAFQSIGYALLWNWTELTGGAYGLPSIPRPIIFGYAFSSVLDFALLGFVFMCVVIYFSHFIYNSNFGRTLKAIRDDSVAAQTLGKKVKVFKIQSVAISCGMTSFAGVLYASYITYIDATSFGVNESLDIVFILVLGGLATIRGSIIGVLFFIISQELFKYFGFDDDIAFNLRNILFASTIIVLLYYRPKGLVGKLEL
jgi:branched-chain amino acid transport system permease protein